LIIPNSGSRTNERRPPPRFPHHNQCRQAKNTEPPASLAARGGRHAHGAPLVATLGDVSNSLQSEIGPEIENELLGRGLRTATPMVLGTGIALIFAAFRVLHKSCDVLAFGFLAFIHLDIKVTQWASRFFRQLGLSVPGQNCLREAGKLAFMSSFLAQNRPVGRQKYLCNKLALAAPVIGVVTGFLACHHRDDNTLHPNSH